LVLGPVSPCEADSPTFLSFLYPTGHRLKLKVRYAWQTDSPDAQVFPTVVDDLQNLYGELLQPPATLTPLPMPTDGFTHGTGFRDAEWITQSELPRGGALKLVCDEYPGVPARVRLIVERLEVTDYDG